MTRLATRQAGRFRPSPAPREAAASGGIPHPVSLLSFVSYPRTDGKPGRCFWSPPEFPRASPDAERRGFEMAAEFFAWRRAHPGHGPLLPSIVADMAGRMTTCEIAFLCGIEGYRHSEDAS